MKILKAKGRNADIKFIYLLMQSIKFALHQHKRYWISQYSKIKIPPPSFKVQKKLVAEAEKVEEIIDVNKRLITIMEGKINDVMKNV